MSIVTKYLSLESLAATPLGEILSDMDELGAGQLAMTVRDDRERVMGGIILLRGENADRYMRAIEAVEREIEDEEE